MGKHKSSLQTHHLYLGAGGMLAVAALVIALTFGLSSAQIPPTGGTIPSGGGSMPPSGGQMPSSGGYMPPSGGQMPGGQMPGGQMPGGQMPGQMGQYGQAGQQGQYGQHGSADMPPCGPNVQPTPQNPCRPSGTQPGSQQGQQGQQGQTGQQGQFPGGQQGQQMRECGPNEQPTAQNPCRPSGTQPGGQPGQQSQQSQVECPALGNRRVSPQECSSATPVCQAGQTPERDRCRPEGGPSTTGRLGEQPRSGEQQRPSQGFEPQCSDSMQKCPDFYNPSRSVCMPKQTSWDPKTHQQLSQPRAATCDDFKPEQPREGEHRGPFPGGERPGSGPFESFPGAPGFFPGGPGFGFPGVGPGREGQFPGKPQFVNPFEQRGETSFQKTGSSGEMMKQFNPCEVNPFDPFCQGGFDPSKIQKQFKFDEKQFDPTKFQFSNLKQEVRNLQREAREWRRDVEQARRQIKEVSRESSGFTCPAIVEVDALATSMEDAAKQAEALSDASSEADIKKALALRDFVNGKYDPQTRQQATSGKRSELFGGPPGEDGKPKPGKIQALHMCREISGIIHGACEASKHMSEEAKRLGLSEDTSVKGALAALEQRCKDPIGVLKAAGVSFDVLSQPFFPDPDKCGFGGPFPFGGPGGGPGSFGGPGGGNGGFEFGPPPGFDFGGLPEEFKQKIQEFSKGGFSGGFGGGSFGGGFGGESSRGGVRGSPFGTAVLLAPSHPDFIGPRPGPDFEMPEECKSPVMRYLGFEEIIRKIQEAFAKGYEKLESKNACKMFEMGLKFFEKGADRARGEFGPPPEVKPLLEHALAACKEGDTKKVEELKEKMFVIGRRGGPGREGKGEKNVLGVDVEELVKDKVKEKVKEQIKGLLGDKVTKESDSALEALQKKVEELTAKLGDAQKTIVALNDKLADMTTKLASAVGKLDEKAAAAVNSIAQLPDKKVQNAVAANISDLATKAGALQNVLPEDAKKVLDATMNSLIKSPPSTSVVSNFKDSLTAIQSYASSGATEKEVVEKVQTELAKMTVNNAADVENKVKEGIVASKDTADLSQWYAAPALQAKSQGFIAKELEEIKPAESETKCAAVTRYARVLEKAGEIEIDLNNKDLVKNVPGAPDWCKPFLSALQEEGVAFALDLNDPNASASRLDIAVLAHEALGAKLPEPPKEELEKYLTDDVKKLPKAQQEAIAAVRYNGIMDTVDGANFGAQVTFNRAQNALVTVKAFEAVKASIAATAK